MSCPDEIAEVVLEMLQVGLLRIRSLGWDKNPIRCAVEADHLHNLPSLLKNYSPDLLKYYLEVERPCYIQAMPPDDERAAFSPLWERLAVFCE
jgi:hypothetical protein